MDRNSPPSAERCLLLALLSGLCLAFAVPFALFFPFRLALLFFTPLHYAFQIAAIGAAIVFFQQLGGQSGTAGRAGSWLLLLAWLYAELAGFLPVTARDALIYQLYVPSEWLRTDRIVEIPWHESSYYPLLLGISYAPFIAGNLESLCGPYHASFLLLTAAVAASLNLQLSRKPGWALATGLLTVTTPLCFRLATEAMADLALMTYFGCAIFFGSALARNPGSRRLAPIVGLALGLSLSAKYSAIVATALFLLSLAGLMIAYRTRLQVVLRLLLSIVTVMLLIDAPWGLRNYLWTGDPIFPLLKGYVGEGKEYAFVGNIPPMTYRHEIYHESWLSILLIPIRIVTSGEDGSARTFDGMLSPLLLLSLFPLIRFAKIADRRIWLYLFVPLGVHLVIVPFLHHLLTRYHAPFAASAFALSMYGGELLLASLPQFAVRKTALLLGAAHCLVAISYGTRHTIDSDLIPFLSGRMSTESYLERHVSEMRIAKVVNATLPEGSRVYLLFTGNRYFLYHREVRGAYFSAKIIVDTLLSDPSPQGLLNAFQRIGVTHLAFEDLRLARILNVSFHEHPELRDPWLDFAANHLRALSRTPPYSLWAIEYGPRP